MPKTKKKPAWAALRGSELSEWICDSLDKQEPFRTESQVEEAIKATALRLCPEGYSMTIRSNDEWKAIADAVNIGIDSHLEAFTKSTFDNGSVLVHPEEMHILLRRMVDIAIRLANENWEAYEVKHGNHDGYEAPEDPGEGLWRCIIEVLCSEDDD